MNVHHEGGLNEHFKLEDPDANAYYVAVQDGATIRNRGFPIAISIVPCPSKRGAVRLHHLGKGRFGRYDHHTTAGWLGNCNQ